MRNKKLRRYLAFIIATPFAVTLALAAVTFFSRVLITVTLEFGEI